MKNNLTLVIGNKNYSSWSLRPWLALKQAKAPFREVRIPIHQKGSGKKIDSYSKAGRVPILFDGKVKVWESLAICEYAAEKFPQARLWPADPASRAEARAVANEMHAGFVNLRRHMPMNCRASIPLKKLPAPVQADVNRVTSIWKECRNRYGKKGPFLFGAFTAADAMYAPICLRFRTYGVKLDPVSRAYAESVLSLPAVREWVAAARREKEIIPDLEVKPS
ncbi:MAG TPA: glutathione S-transferase family protein [Verrucomicrobiae bacterium]|jgi:glutathione S-transferase|nr:glutathione S-transferase family protein [Verrucomicrobiae bacterium]